MHGQGEVAACGLASAPVLMVLPRDVANVRYEL